MQAIHLRDKDQIEAFLRRNTYLNIYQLGDLDDRYWPHTAWYALMDGKAVHAVALLYNGLSTPTLLAMGRDDEVPLVGELLRAIMHLLPGRFYAHLAIGLGKMLSSHYRVESRGEHYKMALTDTSKVSGTDTSAIVQLSDGDADELLDFYAESYPGHWFEPSMLDTGQYFAVRDAGRLLSVAGVHVYSRRYKVAALGNVATHPACRGQGLAKAAVAGLCKNLLKTVQHIGLNVKADNRPAVACYEKLGFQIAAAYEECDIHPL